MCRLQTVCSDNSGISCKCGKYLQVFKHLNTLNLTATAVKVFISLLFIDLVLFIKHLLLAKFYFDAVTSV